MAKHAVGEFLHGTSSQRASGYNRATWATAFEAAPLTKPPASRGVSDLFGSGWAGLGMSKWKTENHFVSWLRLCPDNRISGNKVIGKGRLPTNNPITIAFEDGGQHLTTKQNLSGSAVPLTTNQTRGSSGHQGHGRQGGSPET